MRADLGETDIAFILAVIGGLIDASLPAEPDPWRRYLAIVLNGMQRGANDDEFPGKPPAQPLLDRVFARWVPPRRS